MRKKQHDRLIAYKNSEKNFRNMLNHLKMELGVRWERGSFRIKVKLKNKCSSIVDEISNHLKIPKEQILIYSDHQCKKSISMTRTIEDTGIKDHSFIYVHISGTLPETPICQSGMPSNYQDQYLEGDQSDPFKVQRMKLGLPPRTITLSFLEHRNQLKPQINIQEESSTYAIRISEEALDRFRTVSDFSVHCLLFLFGRINEITGKVTVHTSLAPP